MTIYIIGNIGKFKNPYDYLYNKDLEHPSDTLCFCGKHLNIGGNTSSLPIRWYYNKTCVYHNNYVSKYIYEYDYKEYELDHKTKEIKLLGKVDTFCKAFNNWNNWNNWNK